MPLCCVALAKNDSGKVGWGRAGGVLKRSKSGKRNTVAILEGHPVHSLFNSHKSSLGQLLSPTLTLLERSLLKK